MAYLNTLSLYKTNRAAVLSELWAQIVLMGWELHDNQDASSYRVYKSNGEASDRIYEYIKIDWITTNRITFRAHYFWNATTHVGVGLSAGACVMITAETGLYIWIHGNKNIVSVSTKISTAYASMCFGHLPKRFWETCLATTQNAETAGASVVMETSNTTGFKVGKYYQIVGAAGEGRDRIQVSAINSGVSLTITTLPRNYAAGALIGNCPSTFGNSPVTNSSFYHTCPYNVIGTATAGTGLTISALLQPLYVDPDSRQEDAYILQPILYTADSDIVGYIDNYLLHCPTTGLLAEDVFGVDEIDAGTSSGGNTVSTLNDTTKAWPVNAHQNKVAIITAGLGSGQIRKITSNAGTQLVLAPDYTTIPDATSQYSICEEGYRLMDFTYKVAMREGV